MTDAKGQQISYTYNLNDKVINMKDQSGKVETYEYDFNGNVTKITDRKGQVANYRYDNLNRITRIDYADGSYTEGAYDAVGRLIRIYDSVSGPIEYEYSNTGCTTGCSGGVADKVIKETNPLGVISYTYNALGRRTSMTVAGQSAVNYQYDPNSRFTNISTFSSAFGTLNFNIYYDSLGFRTSLTYPNGMVTNYKFDNASSLLNLEHLNPLKEILESINYSYDESGNIIAMNRRNAPVKLPNPTSNITYELTNKMRTYNDKAITYDDNGNMTSITNSCGTTIFTWDARNRLVAINGFTITSDSTCTPLTANFKYDAFDRRIEKAINGKTIQYVYDKKDIVQEIKDGMVLTSYLRTLSPDEPLARLTPDSSRFYQTDALGSVIAMADETGAIKTQYVYDPFGNVTLSGETSDNPFQYTARENDGTGLYYYRARYYSPDLQRFISDDPMRLKAGINFYTYVANNPVNWIDPWGLKSVIVPENPWDWQPIASGRPPDVTVLDPGTLDPTVRWDTTKEYGISPDKTSELLLRALVQGLSRIPRIIQNPTGPIPPVINEDLIKKLLTPRPAEAETLWAPCK